MFEQSDGTLYVLGNLASITGDNVTITQDATTGDVSENITGAGNSQVSSATFAGVSAVTISTPGGNNTIDVDPSVTVPVSLFAGAGGTVTSTSASTAVIDNSTATTLAASAATAAYGQSVILTATVAPAVLGNVAPTGAVDFYDDTTGTDLGSRTLGSNGIATLSTSNLALGGHTILATYSGDSSFPSSQATASIAVVAQTLSLQDVTVNNLTVGALVDKGGIATLAGDVVNVDGAAFTVTVDWGANQTDDTIGFPAGTDSFSITHQYVDDGSDPFAVSYAIAVTVTTSDNRTVSGSTSVQCLDACPDAP